MAVSYAPYDYYSTEITEIVGADSIRPNLFKNGKTVTNEKLTNYSSIKIDNYIIMLDFVGDDSHKSSAP